MGSDHNSARETVVGSRMRCDAEQKQELRMLQKSGARTLFSTSIRVLHIFSGEFSFFFISVRKKPICFCYVVCLFVFVPLSK